MLYYAAVFFIIALMAAVFGFTGIAIGAAEIAKILFLIFLVLFAVSLVVGRSTRHLGRAPTRYGRNSTSSFAASAVNWQEVDAARPQGSHSGDFGWRQLWNTRAMRDAVAGSRRVAAA